MKKWGLYEWSILLFFVIVPVVAIITECYIIKVPITRTESAFKWFVFSGIGLRLLGAGLKQTMNPSFTAREIFKLTDDAVFPIVRELGFANLCFATIAIISLFIPSFRAPSAVAGGMYFGLAGGLHLFQKEKNSEEIFAMVSDIFIFLVITSLFILVLFY